MPSGSIKTPDVAHVANQALSAWRDNRDIELELHAGADACEWEQLEVLQAAVACLKAEQDRPGTFPSPRLRAAVRLLENLATYAG